MNAVPLSGEGPIKSKWAGYCFMVLICLALLPILPRWFFTYLPTPEWASSGHGPILAAALLITILMSVLILLGLGEKQINHSLEQAVVVIASPVVIAILFYSAIFGGLPKLYTAVAGRNLELRVTVENPSAPRVKGCSRRIKLRDMPFFNDSLCGFADEFRNSLKPGDVLIVSGRGSRFGIFVRSVAVAK